MKPLDLLFFGIFISMIVITIPVFSIKPYADIQVDEQEYHNIVEIWNSQGLQAVINYHDNKPLPFLYIQKLLGGGYSKTRILNLILIGINTLLIFKLTKRKESFLYPLIPLFLNSMWLTVETIETMFLLLSFTYSKHQGIFIGLAALIRPYSALYTLLERRTQAIHTLTMGAIFLIWLYFIGGLSYIQTLIGYGTAKSVIGTDYIAVFFLILFALTCIKNKEMLKWGVVACAPLIIRMFAHYFITPYSLFFLGYLMTKEE